MLHASLPCLRRVTLSLGAFVVLGFASGWVPNAAIPAPVALAIHEPSEPTPTDNPWGGGEP
jgi:hypothetical protein